MTTSRTEATSLVRQVSIDAPAATVFKYLVDPSLMTRWMGQNCIFEPFEGGEYRCEINDNIVAGGRVLEVVQDQKIVYTFGWEGDENPGDSRVIKGRNHSRRERRLDAGRAYAHRARRCG